MSAPILHTDSPVEVLDLLPLCPDGTTGAARLTRAGRVVTASGCINLPAPWNVTLTIPDRFTPADTTSLGTLLLFWPWDQTTIRSLQWTAGAFGFYSGPARPPAGRNTLAGSWVAKP